MTGFDTSKLAAKSYLASLKADVNKTDIDKLKTVPADLNKLSNVVDNADNANKTNDYAKKQTLTRNL